MTSQEILNIFNITLVHGMVMPIEIPNVERENLAKWFEEWGLNEGAEIGTFRGTYANVLCSNNPNLKLHCIDSWKIYPGYADYSLQRTLDRAYKETKVNLAPYNCNIVKEFSREAAKQFANESLDFVYIDGNHELNYVIEDLYTWIPKVKKGGIISGHDYLKRRNYPSLQVVEAAHAYTSAKHIYPWFVLGLKAKSKLDGNYARSWMWVNE